MWVRNYLKILLFLFASYSNLHPQMIFSPQNNTFLLFRQNTDVCARAAGLGNAYTAAVTDVSAIQWNPAALAKTGDLSFYVSSQFHSDNLSPAGFDGDTFLDWHVEKKSQFKFNYFGIVFRWSPLEANVHIGVALAQYEFYPKKENHLVNSDNEISYSWQFQFQSGVISSFTGSASVDLSKNLFLGGSFNFWSTEPEIIAVNRQSTLLTDEGYSFEQKRTMVDHSNFNLGILYTGINNLKMGLKLNFPSDVELRPALLEFTESNYIKNIKIKFPMAFRYGIFYQILPGMNFAFDYSYNPWSQVKIENPINEHKPDFNMHSLHFGLEYNLDLGTLQIPLRTGYYTQPTLIKKIDEDQLVLDVFTMGTGFQYKKFHFDVSFEWMPISYQITRYEFDPNHALENVSFSGDYIRIMLDLGISLDYQGDENPEN